MGVSVNATAGRMPVIAGAAALPLMPPYYTNAPNEGLFQYFEALAGAVSSTAGTGWASPPEDVATLADRIPNLSFWKDGQGDTRKY